MILLWIEQEKMKKVFRRSYLSGKFVSLQVLFFLMKLKIIGKFCFVIFKWPF